MIKKALIIYFTIISALGFTDFANAGQIKITNPNGKKYSVSTKDINGQDYISMSSLSNILFAGGEYIKDRGEIHSSGEALKCAPASFFIVYDKNDDMRIAQMTQPAVDIYSELYLPAEAFFNALKSMNIYDIEINGKEISVNYLTRIGKLPVKEKVNVHDYSAAAKKPKEKKAENEVEDKPSKANKAEAENTIIKRSFIKTSSSLMNGLDNIVAIGNTKNEKIQESSPKTETKKTQPKTVKQETQPPDELFPPNLYVLPPKLIRKELEEDGGK